MLKNLSLKSVYDTSVDNLIEDLFIPLLSESTLYKRGVGYFTSSWLKLALKGIEDFVEDGGEIELVTSPNFEENDWDSVRKGFEAKGNQYLIQKLKAVVEKMDKKENEYINNYLAWLVADELIELKFAIPKNGKGEFHDKFAIFYDQDDLVVIHGSYNDSNKANFNGESYSIFRSWIPGQQEYVKLHEEKFNKIIKEENNFYDIYDIPKAIRDDIVKLRKHERPYAVNSDIDSRGLKLPEKYENLYDYQKEAIRCWVENDYHGILEMATGTGKTITSLAASLKIYELKNRFIIVILVPYQHLIEQWEDDVVLFGYNPIKCASDYRNWDVKLKRKLMNYSKNRINRVSIIATHDTGSGEKFTNIISEINEDILMIGDEMHNLGANIYRKSLLNNYKYRIGLSATPRRWFDEIGSKVIFDYFGDTVFEYSLDEAIKNDFLVEYEFNPRVYHVDYDLIYKYRNLTIEIAKLFHSQKKNTKDSESLKYKIRERSDLVKNNSYKKEAFKNDFKKFLSQHGSKDVQGVLIYCGPGETKSILKYVASLGVRAHEFNSTVVNKKRKKILENFSNGDIQVLIAIKCLDEGVNIPSVKTAFFLASTSNPKEFVQRRGRILRKYKGKTMTNIFDYYIVPELSDIKNLTEEEENVFRSILEKELPRFAEFSDSSVNKYNARGTLLPYLKPLNISHLLDKKPWEVYEENYRKEQMDDAEL